MYVRSATLYSCLQPEFWSFLLYVRLLLELFTANAVPCVETTDPTATRRWAELIPSGNLEQHLWLDGTGHLERHCRGKK